MGIIQRQSFKGSITNLLGVLLGFVATIYVYPLDFEAKGFVDFLVACTTLFIPFANLGLQSVFLKYYPIFQSHNKIENFKGFLFFRFFIQYAIFAAILILFEPFISNFLEITKIDQRREFSRYYLFILILLGIELGNGYLIALSQANRRIVIPQILHNTSQKVVFPALILLRLWLDLSFDHLAYLLIAYYAFILISLTIYNYRLGVLKTKISFTLPINNIKSEVRNFSRYNSLTAISGQFTVNIDRILVAMFVGFSQSGIYSIAAFISNVIAIPLNPMTKISIPILTKEILADNWSEVNDLYKKSSNVLLTVGMALFLFLYFGFDFIVNLTEHSSQLGPGKQVLFLLGLGILFNLATSINSQIIAYSKYYRYSLYFLLILGVNNVVLNIILIGKYGMIGAAWSTMISLLLFNILKVVLLYRVQKLSPFNKNSIKLFLLFAVNYGILALLHWQIELENGLWSFFVNLTVLSVMLLVCYAVPAYFWKTSKEINEMIDDLRERLNSTLKRN